MRARIQVAAGEFDKGEGAPLPLRMASTPLTTAEIEAALCALPGWRCEREALAREFQFADFRAAMAFMVRVGFEADAMDHHPEWTNLYHRVAIRLNTHDAGGRITAKDVALAARISAVAQA
jgi:4a-hydroxytetrahydrobiopterin dehydratase